MFGHGDDDPLWTDVHDDDGNSKRPRNARSRIFPVACDWIQTMRLIPSYQPLTRKIPQSDVAVVVVVALLVSPLSVVPVRIPCRISHEWNL